MSKKKIMLHIIMPNQVSGPNSAAKRIAESYLNEKYEFSFLTQNMHAKGKINFKLINDLTNQIKNYKPDVIHLSGMQASGFHAVVAAKLAGVKNILITIRGFSEDALNISPIKRNIFTKIIEPLTLKLCKNFYTVCSEANEKKMVKKYNKKSLGVIYNAAPEINIDINTTRDKVRRALNANNKDFIVAVSGRMVYDKGISFISKAIENLDLDMEGIKFVFIGDGPYCDILKERHKELIKKERVYVLGSQKKVIEILTGCDLFLFATLHENLSNALLEAMSIGLPVVATKVGGNIEVVNDNVNGYLIPPMDYNSMINAILKIKNDKELHMKFSRESINIIEKKFSQKIIYNKIDKLYKNY